MAALSVAAAVSTAAAMHDAHTGDVTAQRAVKASAPAHATLPAVPGSVVGAYVQGSPGSVAGVDRFESLTETNLREVVYYSTWGEAFATNFAASLRKSGAVPMIQIEPSHVSLASIANGSQDGYLVSYADAIRSFRSAVILSFAHEMNGDWYSWSNPQVAPSTFVAAWRHIVDVFRAQGADNVTWLWTVNVLTGIYGKNVLPSLWWPGSSYVTWVGIAGYFSSSGQTFGSVFNSTIANIRTVTEKPILIAETGVAAGGGQASLIRDLFTGVTAHRLLGIIWFDAKGRLDWRIDSNPAAVKAFQSGVRAYYSSDFR
jgi:mannan endo-1,4-beta-mannosidase